MDRDEVLTLGGQTDSAAIGSWCGRLLSKTVPPVLRGRRGAHAPINCSTWACLASLGCVCWAGRPHCLACS